MKPKFPMIVIASEPGSPKDVYYAFYYENQDELDRAIKEDWNLQEYEYRVVEPTFEIEVSSVKFHAI